MENNKKTYTVVGIIIVVILLILGGTWWYSNYSAEDDFDFTTASSTDRLGSSERPIVAQSTNIIVYAPKANERIGTPLVIEGTARVFENVVNYRLVDSAGLLIAEGFTTADAPDIGQFGPFRGELVYQAETNGTGTLEVFWYSAKDGTPTDVVRIPVTFTKTPEFIKG